MNIDLSRWSPEQRSAIETRGLNLLVSAGAGSGKTSVLVERVVHSVMGPEQVELQNLLVVTFTEAAAAEMRRRIADRLAQLYQQASGQNEADTTRRLSQQMAQVEQAQISTLHSFCMQVVKNNFLFLGIEPVFSLMAEDDIVLLKAEVHDGLVEEMLSGPNSEALAGVITRFAGGQPRRFSELASRLHTFAVSQPNPVKWLQNMADRFTEARRTPSEELPWMPAFLDWACRQIDTSRRAFASAASAAASCEELQAYAENLTAMVELCDTARAALNDASGIEAAAAALRAVFSLKSPRAKDHPVKDFVTAKRTGGLKRLQQLAPLLDRGLVALHEDILQLEPDVRTLVTFVQAFHERYQAAKRQRGQLDFNDLEHYALQALQDPESGEALRLQAHYEEVFVDEYQDTSPIQDAIVTYITRPQGNQFIVGDVKQSIYRFRMAEPDLFLQKYQTLGRSVPGTVIDLSANYRSRAEVVQAVNFLFEQLFSLDFGGISYDERARMRVGANYPTQDEESLAGPVEFHLIARDGRTSESDETSDQDGQNDGASGDGEEALSPDDMSAIEREATVIAERILSLMGRTGPRQHQVWDAKAGVYRPLQYRDIVILMRSVKTRMTPVLEVLRKFGIPAYGATSTGFYGALEVGWLLSALAAVDNPRRELDFATLLRSPMGRFSDEELALIRAFQQGNLYDAWKAVLRANTSEFAERLNVALLTAEALKAKVKTFALLFMGWRRQARKASVEDVVRRMMDDTAFEHYVTGMKGGDIRRANVQVFLEKARAYDRSSADGVYGFVNFAAAALKHDVDVGEARTLGENEDVVRIMTIHQSKGLEYPVVFVADLGKMFYRDPQESAFPLHRKLGFGPQRVDDRTDQRWPTVASVAIESLEHMEFLAEEARVLYVALTRARERLILVGSARNVERLVQTAMERMEPTSTTLPADALLEAKSCLDWILPALCRHRDGSPLRALATAGGELGAEVSGPYWDHPARFAVQLWDLPNSPQVGHGSEVAPTLDLPRFRHQTVDDVVKTLASEAATAVFEVDAAVTEEVGEPSSVVPGKVSATDLRRLWVARHTESGQRQKLFAGSAERLLESPRFVEGVIGSAREGGIAFHAVMQHLDFNTPAEVEAVAKAIELLAANGKLQTGAAEAVSVDEVAAFLRSPIGRRLAGAKRILREQPFFHRLDTSLGGENTFAVAQGVIDCLAEDEHGWILIDYKTDNIEAAHADTKAQEYAAQVAAYLNAAATLTGGDNIVAYLYFTKPAVFVEMGTMDLTRLF